jgi:hypothetical protein
MKTFHYFGYASNLDVATLKGRIKNDPKILGLGVLPHFGFRFNHPNPDGSARANIEPSPNESVYGILFEVQKEDKSFFLTSEPGYDFVEVEVFTPKGNILAWTFISNQTQEGIFPLEIYWKTILKGAKENGLPETYISQILNRIGSKSLLD